MKSLEVSGAVRPIYGSLGVKRLMTSALRGDEWETSRLDRFAPIKFTPISVQQDFELMRTERQTWRSYCARI